MDLASFRRRRGLSQDACAVALGLEAGSKGYLSRIENGDPANLRLALKIEQWSEGEVPAPDLLDPEDRGLLESAFTRRRVPAREGVAA